MSPRSSWDMEDRPGIGWLVTPTPVVKKLLIGNIAVFAAQALLAAASNDWAVAVTQTFALSGAGLRSGSVWQLATYMFLHAGIWHLLFNMFALWMFGAEVEQQLGPRRFLQLYFTSGLVGATCWLAFNWDFGHLMGASAAVYAVLIAFATLVPERPVTLLLFFVLPVTMKAKWWAWIAVGVVAYSSLAESGGGVAHLAHLGGIGVGYVFIKWLGWGQPSRVVEHMQSLTRPVTRIFKRKPKPEELPPEEFISREVDPILDKIAREGIHSLTRRERQVLEAARTRIEKRTSR